MKNLISTPEEINARYIEAYYALYAKRLVANRREFCERTGLIPQSFSQIEQGKRSITMGQVCALITNLNVRSEWIMQGKGDMLQ